MIKILCVGKIKEKFFKDAISEYSKRLSKYTNLQIIEVDDINSDNINTILDKEKDLIIKHISSKDYVITLEIEGKQLSSLELSKKIEELQIYNSSIVFIIGGSYGLHQQIKDRADYKLSFSKLTFPHQLLELFF